MSTLVERLPLDDGTSTSLADRIVNICEVNLPAGYKLATSFVVDDNVFLIFQK